jgi:cytochrome c oxidase cbb3-type subunit III
MRIMRAAFATTLLLAASSLGAQQPPPAPAENRIQGPPAGQGRRRRAEEPQFDAAAAQRGQEMLVARCGFCHGSNARGGAGGGSDLTRSPIVQEDENGKQLDEFLRVGRPERNMPKFELTGQEVADLATFLHSTIFLAANRDLYQILDIVTGDAKAGEAFFQGVGGCASCHSASGDLKGIGAKYDPATLQGRVLLPRGGRGGGPPGDRGFSPYAERTAVKGTVALPSGESFTGALVRLTDFEVTIYDPELRQMHSWLRRDAIPRVVLLDPLQAHVDMLRKWTDRDMQNVTAFLVGLK